MELPKTRRCGGGFRELAVDDALDDLDSDGANVKGLVDGGLPCNEQAGDASARRSEQHPGLGNRSVRWQHHSRGLTGGVESDGETGESGGESGLSASSVGSKA